MVDLQRLCSQSIWLNKGSISAFGKTPEVISEYAAHLDRIAHDRIDRQHTDLSLIDNGPTVKSFRLLDNNGREREEFISGECLRVRMSFDGARAGEPLNFTFSFRTGDSDLYSAYCSAYDGFSVVPKTPSGAVELEIPQLSLGGGIYSTCVGLWDAEYVGTYDWHWDIKQFTVRTKSEMPGHFVFPHSWRQVE